MLIYYMNARQFSVIRMAFVYLLHHIHLIWTSVLPLLHGKTEKSLRLFFHSRALTIERENASTTM